MTSSPYYYRPSIAASQNELLVRIAKNSHNFISKHQSAAKMSKPDIPSLHSKAEYLKAVMYEGVTILEGTATWCEKCKVIAPEVAKMVQEYPNVR
jgi:thiol-disulfide isomerase/thioredoxin